jgi:hypothetical protein
MTIWDWIGEYYKQAAESGDEQRMLLPQYQIAGYKQRETNPWLAQGLFEEGSKLARQLNEPWWVLIYDHWRVTGYLFFQRDYREVLDLAVQNALEVRKPQYDHFPLKFSILRDLVEAYIGIEPAAYLEQIQQTLDYLAANAPEEGSDRFLIHGTRRDLAIEMGWIDQAEEVARGFQPLADSLPSKEGATHHSAFNWCGWCEIAWHKRDMDLLLESALEGEKAARESSLKMEMSACQIWRAVAERATGHKQEASRLYRQGVNQVSRLQMPPDRGCFEGLCAFHELIDALDMILQMRRAELEIIQEHGRLAYESRCRNRICRLLARLGEPFAGELAAARVAAQKLRKPEASLAELDQTEAMQG